jgi:hypothetical protein
MMNTEKLKVREKVNKIKNNHKILTFIFVVLFSISLLFCGGALVVTFENGGILESGWTGVISWMWLPALFFFTLSTFRDG